MTRADRLSSPLLFKLKHQSIICFLLCIILTVPNILLVMDKRKRCIKKEEENFCVNGCASFRQTHDGSFVIHGKDVDVVVSVINIISLLKVVIYMDINKSTIINKFELPDLP